MAPSDPTHYRHGLPHWRADNSIYFVTWQLARSQPSLNPDEPTLVRRAIGSFEGSRYQRYAFVVMNDHVHVLIRPHLNHSVESILHSWKSFTANRMQRESLRTGRLWQDEYFDRAVRDRKKFEEKHAYLLTNPFKRWPKIESYAWVWSRAEDGS